ncbi:replication terminator protein [Pseudalkalibacillus caeni]|uniref:Replication terminator protein n=1 Tax=Exobacillus caeni TaxID=2574798 RepID=A0A5R9FB40_9BACL|nr:replication terminator protein [Pseudalkalibacillus caeni]TLS37764.1 replication terminator protein [Pseudalkalibacillus caeni]
MKAIDLQNFADGALAERFNHELGKVLENIADPNTDPKKARKVTLTVTLKADEQRDIAQVGIVAKSTIVPAKDIETKIIMDTDNTGKVIGSELKSGQKGQTYIDDEGDVADDTGNKVIEYQRRTK